MSESVKTQSSNTFLNIVNILKKKILLIIITILVVSCVGVVLVNVKKPSYIAKESINYLAKSKVDPDNTKNNINAMRDYIDTVIDFCDEEIVILRADGLYDGFVKSNETIDDFIQDYVTFYLSSDYKIKMSVFGASMKSVTSDFEDSRGYRKSGEVIDGQRHYFYSNMVFATKVSNTYDNSTSFVFNMSLKDDKSDIAKNKLRILALAVKIESFDAFGGVDTYVNETVSQTSDITFEPSFKKIEILLVFFVIGIFLALLFVYFSVMFDKSIKSKEVFELITKSNVIGFIPKQEDIKNV